VLLVVSVLALAVCAKTKKAFPYAEPPAKLDTPEEKFSWAVKSSNLPHAIQLLLDHPDLDVNWKAPNGGFTALHMAANNGYEDTVRLLLTHPDIDVNLLADQGFSATLVASQGPYVGPLRELLGDSRVDVNRPCDLGMFPLFVMAYDRRYEYIMWAIASGRDLNIQGKTLEKTPLQVARERNATEAIVILEAYEMDPKETVTRIRHDLQITGQFLSLVRPGRLTDLFLFPHPRQILGGFPDVFLGFFSFLFCGCA